MTDKKQNRNDKEEPHPPIKLIKLDRSFKLAMQWVNSMSGSWDDEADTVELQARPPRVGLGAEIPQKLEVRQQHTDDRTEWKLRAILDPRRRKKASKEEEPIAEARDDQRHSDDDEPESRCSAFTKRRAAFPPASSVPTNSMSKKGRLQLD